MLTFATVLKQTESAMRAYLILLLSCIALPTVAQSGKRSIFTKVDSILTARYNKVSYDTMYMTRPNTKFTVKVMGNVYGHSYSVKSNLGGVSTEADLRTARKATLSVGFNYQGVGISLALNPSKLAGVNRDYELNFNIYNNRYCISATYQSSRTMSGDITTDGKSYQVEKGYINTKMFRVTGYYVFNRRKFSYPAAFTQSYIQLRSAGSWLAGFSFQGGTLKTAADVPKEMSKVRIYAGNFGIGGGYAHNWVARKWLFHLSILPTLVVYQSDNITVDEERQYSRVKFPTVMLNEQAAIVYNISPRYFVGLMAVANNLLKRSSSDTELDQHKWMVRASYGMRF